MFIIFLYLIFAFYFVTRVIFLIAYLIVNRDMVINIEKRKIDSDNEINFKFSIPDSVYINK